MEEDDYFYQSPPLFSLDIRNLSHLCSYDTPDTSSEPTQTPQFIIEEIIKNNEEISKESKPKKIKTYQKKKDIVPPVASPFSTSSESSTSRSAGDDVKNEKEIEKYNNKYQFQSISDNNVKNNIPINNVINEKSKLQQFVDKFALVTTNDTKQNFHLNIKKIDNTIKVSKNIIQDSVKSLAKPDVYYSLLAPKTNTMDPCSDNNTSSTMLHIIKALSQPSDKPINYNTFNSIDFNGINTNVPMVDFSGNEQRKLVNKHSMYYPDNYLDTSVFNFTSIRPQSFLKNNTNSYGISTSNHMQKSTSSLPSSSGNMSMSSSNSTDSTLTTATKKKTSTQNSTSNKTNSTAKKNNSNSNPSTVNVGNDVLTGDPTMFSSFDDMDFSNIFDTELLLPDLSGSGILDDSNTTDKSNIIHSIDTKRKRDNNNINVENDKIKKPKAVKKVSAKKSTTSASTEMVVEEGGTSTVASNVNNKDDVNIKKSNDNKKTNKTKKDDNKTSNKNSQHSGSSIDYRYDYEKLFQNRNIIRQQEQDMSFISQSYTNNTTNNKSHSTQSIISENSTRLLQMQPLLSYANNGAYHHPSSSIIPSNNQYNTTLPTNQNHIHSTGAFSPSPYVLPTLASTSTNGSIVSRAPSLTALPSTSLFLADQMLSRSMTPNNSNHVLNYMSQFDMSNLASSHGVRSQF